MIHDRASFGGALVAIGLLYVWLGAIPLRQGEGWAWWLFLLSGLFGFGTFLAYLGYGYLDTWHGIGTLLLIPCFTLGLVRSKASLRRNPGIRSLLYPSVPMRFFSAHGIGRACLLGVAASMMVGGLTILVVGTTCVFVPQDLRYLGLPVTELHALNPRLVPLIAHDRAGFGGAVCCCGILLLFCIWCGRPSPSLWCLVTLAGTVGFGTAIGVHFTIGYTDPVHLAPAVAGAVAYLAGLSLTFRPMMLIRSTHPVTGPLRYGSPEQICLVAGRRSTPDGTLGVDITVLSEPGPTRRQSGRPQL
jgi:hypothetical protein